MKNVPYSQIFVALAATLGGFMFGTFLGWSAPSIPILLENEHFQFSISEAAWAVSILPLGGSLSCVPAGMIRNRFGTKVLITIYSIPSILGWMLKAFAINSWMVILARFLCGIAGVGFVYIISVYIGEISSKEYRGRLTGLLRVAIAFGVAFIYVLGSMVSLRTVNIFGIAMSVIYLIIFTFLPETPVYQLKKGRNEGARRSLKLLRKASQRIEDELKDLQAIESKSKGSFFKDLENKATRKAFIIIIVMFILFQTCGAYTVVFYSSKILTESGIEIDKFVSSTMLGAVQVFAVLFALPLVDYKGRKFLLFSSFLIMAVGLLSIAIYFHLKSNEIEFQDLKWIPFASVIVYFIGFNSGLGTVTFILMGEIFSTSAKKIVAPLAMTANFFSSFLVTLIFPHILINIGMHLMFYLFTLSCAFGFIFTWKVVPETKGISLREIQKILEGKEEKFEVVSMRDIEKLNNNDEKVRFENLPLKITNL